MPDGIRPLKDQTCATRDFTRLRAVATALLFLLLWAGTLGPAAMATTLTPGLAPQLLLEHGGETPPTQETMPSLSLTRTSTRLHLPAVEVVVPAPMPAVSPAPAGRRISRRPDATGSAPRRSPPRGRRRGRAPPR